MIVVIVGTATPCLAKNLRNWDKNGDKKISKIEYRAYCHHLDYIHRDRKRENREIDRVFAGKDKNKDGYITKDENSFW